MNHITVLHFNDVYRVVPQKINKSGDTIDVTQFAAIVDGLRVQHPDALLLFSGDVFSPSVESSVTRGSHMVPVLNYLKPDVSLTGNHDFDAGYPHLTKLINHTTFPWILSNVIDSSTGKTPACLQEFHVLERSNVRIGVVGLVEKEWITTVPAWPENFVYKDMTEVGMDLSRRLRDPNGEYKCDLIFALSHSRIQNDITLAGQLMALSPWAQAAKRDDFVSSHGVDIIFGGHDHFYYAGRGVSFWEGYDTSQPVVGVTDNDELNGLDKDVLVVKSGTDFRDLSEVSLQLSDTPEGSVRRKAISFITGKRHSTMPESKSSQALANMLKNVLSSVSSIMKKPVCKTNVTLNCRSEYVRTEESASGNWFADVIRHAYDDAANLRDSGGSDGVLICGGTVRGDSEYGPGIITLGDILEILPFEDPIVVLELDGEAIWQALESGLETWPRQEGRFPIVSGIRVSWDSRRPPGQRVLGVWLTKEREESIVSNGESGENSGQSTPHYVDGPAVENVKGGKLYKIVTREYMAQGHDGYSSLLGRKYLVEEEAGQMMSTIVRRYLMGLNFVNHISRNYQHGARDIINASSLEIIAMKLRRIHHESKALQRFRQTANRVVHQIRAHSKKHYLDHLCICVQEHMSAVDPVDGVKLRNGEEALPVDCHVQDLPLM
ncbi:Metallo-dependent phosphatase [Fistulina hepatica ATCC 64428]|nr:Metallo-dependent phosphatase [Fistulina hepatica ATCC 64428]